MATLEEVLNQTTDNDYIHDPIQFLIDNNLRIITIPPDGVVAGVIGDKNVNRINFQMSRYYNGFDMSSFEIRISYVNANGDSNYYVVDDATTEDDVLLFTWLIESDAVAYVGTVTFGVNLLRIIDGVIVQAFNTADPSELSVLDGLNVFEQMSVEEQKDIFQHIQEDVEKNISETLNSAKESAIDEFTRSFTDISDKKISEVEEKGDLQMREIEAKGNEMLSDLKRKLYLSDEKTGKEYAGELKIINGKPVLEYEEVRD